MNFQKPKTCCITGHREIEETKLENVKATIRKAVLQAVDDGYSHFISGFADDVDLYFAEIVAELKEKHHLTLEAFLPYPNKENTSNATFQSLLTQCNAIGVLSDKYSPVCLINRNRFMVNESDLVIAVYDGREKGSTFFTIRYAHTLGREVKIINV